ncbi:MAG: DNA gyrase inhibitor YacG [Thermoguttaceae bacterium]
MRCSICGTVFDPDRSRAMPFCSQRCKDIDANRWLDEQYGMPWEPEEESAPGTERPLPDDDS